MKCSFSEALDYFGYSVRVCIIDNTHLAVLHGTGKTAVFQLEMIAFADKYGFVWKAHRIKHSNRKAGIERNFLTLEKIFFPGRSFKSMADLNAESKERALKYRVTNLKSVEKTRLARLKRAKIPEEFVLETFPYS